MGEGLLKRSEVGNGGAGIIEEEWGWEWWGRDC